MASDRIRHSEDSSHRSALKEAGPYLTLGLELGFTMIIWSVIGYILDRWLDTLPWLTMAGALIGMVSVFILLARVARRSSKGVKHGDESGDRTRGPRSGPTDDTRTTQSAD